MLGSVVRDLAAVVILTTCVSVVVSANEIHGRVVAVADGDTITVLDVAKQQHHIRLNGIDAPEAGQPFAAVSKAHLSDLLFGRDVRVVGDKTDRYGRRVGTVFVGDVNANYEQLRAGLAWYYRFYASDVGPADRQRYDRAEAAARAARVGLWRDPSPIEPWAFRAPSTPASVVNSTSRDPAGRLIIGNTNSRIYHLPNCRSYDAVAERNRVYFSTEDEARAAGFRVARNCD